MIQFVLKTIIKLNSKMKQKTIMNLIQANMNQIQIQIQNQTQTQMRLDILQTD